MAASSITDRIRSACQSVAENAEFVTIHHDRIGAYAQSLPSVRETASTLDPEYHRLGQGAETAAFIVTLDTINFGSGYFPYLRKRPGKSGYFTIAGALNDHFRNHGPFTAEALIDITAGDCFRIFDQNPSVLPVRELMQHYSAALNELGRYLKRRFAGSFTSLVRAAEASVDELIRLLSRMPYFNDVHQYHTLEVPLYKRAQLMAADLSLAFGGQGIGRFEDLNRLTLFADNLVPHVLRIDGVLSYDAHLLQRINIAELIPAGSPEEIEIRSCAVHAVECIKNELRHPGQRVTSQALDYLLWNRGQHPAYKSVPRHRTRTVHY